MKNIGLLVLAPAMMSGCIGARNGRTAPFRHFLDTRKLVVVRVEYGSLRQADSFVMVDTNSPMSLYTVAVTGL